MCEYARYLFDFDFYQFLFYVNKINCGNGKNEISNDVEIVHILTFDIISVIIIVVAATYTHTQDYIHLHVDALHHICSSITHICLSFSPRS